jgi:hypothetical protein
MSTEATNIIINIVAAAIALVAAVKARDADRSAERASRDAQAAKAAGDRVELDVMALSGSVNGRLERLLAETARAAHAAGVVAGAKEEAVKATTQAAMVAEALASPVPGGESGATITTDKNVVIRGASLTIEE